MLLPTGYFAYYKTSNVWYLLGVIFVVGLGLSLCLITTIKIVSDFFNKEYSNKTFLMILLVIMSFSSYVYFFSKSIDVFLELLDLD